MLTDKLIPGKIVHWTNFDTAMMMYKYCRAMKPLQCLFSLVTS